MSYEENKNLFTIIFSTIFIMLWHVVGLHDKFRYFSLVTFLTSMGITSIVGL
jgi:hypothetical protein